ncbi:hypothetical protein O0L34_g12146 [Tuta absoluta]|nr:hypothetical protein O0L34_g12146 [Tuta absoluta]
MQPQFTREGFTFLTTNCIFNVDVIATTTPPSPTTLSPPTSKSISIEDNDGNKEAEASAETLNQDSGSSSVNMNNVWYGIGALAVIVLAVIVLVVGRRTCKQAKLEQKREQNEFDYENLQNDTPERQFPPNLENAYSLPYDSLGRPRAATDNISEISPYAVANYQGTAPSDTYSIPHVEKDLSKLYSKPVPKSLRKELMYSKVLPKNMRKQDTPVKPQEISYAELETTISGRNQFKPVETTYSEVVTGYTNVNDKVNDYKNVVLPNSRYCNANDTEYAEPAYCELAKDTKKMVDRKK